MTTLVKRDDLSTRTALSKSTLVGFDICPTKAWHEIHHRLPLIPDEKITFGSAVDAAVEAAIKYLRAGQPVDEAVCLAAAGEVIERDQVAVNTDEVEHALTLFMVQIAPNYDWSFVRLQEHVYGEIEDLGAVDGHPDAWFPRDGIFDVKTAKREKFDERTVELGFYALLAREVRNEPVSRVGYWTYARTSRPHWQTLEFPVTDEYLQWTVEKAAAYVRAKRLDESVNAKTQTPSNWTMTAGPKYGASSCQTCQYAAMCSIAIRGAMNDDNAA